MAQQLSILLSADGEPVCEWPHVAVCHLEVAGLDRGMQVAIDGAHRHAKSLSEDPLRDVRASMHLVQDRQIKGSNGLPLTASLQFQGRLRRSARRITSPFTARIVVRQVNIGTQQKPVASQPALPTGPGPHSRIGRSPAVGNGETTPSRLEYGHTPTPSVPGHSD